MDTNSLAETSAQSLNTIVSTLTTSAPLKIIVGLLILIVGIVMVRIIMKRLSKLFELNPFLSSVQGMLRSAIRFGLDLIVVLIAASYVGIPITSIIAFFSIVGIAISLALQGLLTNLTAGITILASKPFIVGHFIESGGFTGTVKEIRILHTKLQTPDDRLVYMPNNVLFTSSVINYTASGRRKLELSVSASYQNSPEEVRKAIMTAIKKTPGILADPAPQVLVNQYGDSAISYLIWVWLSPTDYLSVKFKLNELLYTAFQENNVEMTYPHLNVHMRN